MSDAEDNPFERWDIDPMAGPSAITERMRELAEDAPDEETRAAIREAWEALTMHPRGRLEAAFEAHPETRAPVGRRPRPPRRAAQPEPSLDELTLRDLAALPRVASALHADVEIDPLPDVPLDRDPILTGEET